MTPYRKTDELAYFQQIIRGIRSNESTRMHFDAFLHDLPIALKNFVSESMSLSTIRLEDGSTQIRKILHVNRAPN